MSRSKTPSRRPPHVAYLLRMYPRFSQTFIVNEILELQRRGLHLSIGSLRKPTDGVFHASIARVRGRVDYFPESILSEPAKMLRLQWARLRKRPAACAQALRIALRYAGANLTDLAQAACVVKWAAKNKIDHLHVHFGTHEATVAYLAHLLGGRSYSMTLHAFDIFRDTVDRALLARKINASRFTITVSEFNRRFILEHIPGVNPEKVRVHYNGIDTERFGAADTPREPDMVFGVGRLIEKKGFTHLIRAIELLRDEGLSVRCRIAGEGPLRAALQDQIDCAGLGQQVELAGPLEQAVVGDWMKRATCFCLPCVQAADGNIDALPTVLLESLASGCPSISTRISGVPEIIEDRLSGLLAAPGDARALARAIRQVIENPALAASLAREGRRRAAERFDVRKNAVVLNDWLLDAAGSSRSVFPEVPPPVDRRPVVVPATPGTVSVSS
ncbi:MAG: glycosyltransferase [Phycisphaerae bacterium]